MRKLVCLRILVIGFCSLLAHSLLAQVLTEKEVLIKKLSITSDVPKDLLSTRAIVLYDPSITQSDLEETQKSFQQTGIDAVGYLRQEMVLAGSDPLKAFVNYISSRSIDYLILFEKEKGYSFTFFKFNKTLTLADEGTGAWQQRGSNLKDLLYIIFRLAISNQKKQNLLINDFPETDIRFRYFTGNRSEAFTNDAKAFKIAVPKFANEKDNEELEQILKEYFPVRYELVDASISERELSNRGFRTILNCIHTSGSAAKEILDYDLTQVAKSISSIYNQNGQQEIKTIPAQQHVYKFYVKHIEYGNLYLGKNWDADTTWQSALKNHLIAMRDLLKF